MKGISSDGDSRTMSVMRRESKLGKTTRCLQPKLPGNFNCDFSDVVYVQDDVHILTKLRNRLLKPSILLPFGNKQVSIAHLKMLLNKVPKDLHGLVLGDICPEDRQNFKSFEKLMQPRVSDALKKFVPDSQATVLYLKICSQIYSSYENVEIAPLDRLLQLWQSVFLLRIWRNWISEIDKKNKKDKTISKPELLYNLQNNFISSNAYECIELNAHSLLQLIVKFRNQKNERLFLPFLFNSQTCEKTFRQLRSMGTMNYTKVNFTLLELLHKFKRIEIMNNIAHLKLNASGLKLPRTFARSEKMVHHEFPSDEDIIVIIEKAKNAAIKEASEFGIFVSEKLLLSCQLTVSKQLEEHAVNNKSNDGSSELKDNESDDDLLNNIEDDINRISLNGYIRNYQLESINLSDASPFFKVSDDQNNSKIVRKSSYLWLLRTSKGSLSNDRLKRVQMSELEQPSKRYLGFCNQLQTESFEIRANKEIQIGQIVFFAKRRARCIQAYFRGSDEEIFETILTGIITGFRYIEGKAQKDRQYSWDFASVEVPKEQNSRGIEVQATWHKIGRDGEMVNMLKDRSYYINIDNYLFTLYGIKLVDDKLIVTASEMNEIFTRSIQMVKKLKKMK